MVAYPVGVHAYFYWKQGYGAVGQAELSPVGVQAVVR